VNISFAEHDGHTHEEAERVHIAAAADGLWCAEGSALRWIPGGALTGETVYTAAGPIRGVAALGEDVYFLAESGGRLTVYLYAGGSQTARELFSVRNGQVRAAAAAEGGLAVLYEPGEEQLRDLSLEGGLLFYTYTGRLLSLPVGRVMNMTAPDDHTLLLVRFDGDEFRWVHLDLRAMQTEVLLERYMLAALPFGEGGVIYATHSHLFYMDQAGYSTQWDQIAAEVFDPPQLLWVKEDLYVLDAYGLRILNPYGIMSLNAREDAVQLTLVNCLGIEDFRLDAAVRHFEAATGVRVILTEMNRQQLLTQLIAGESGADILFVDAYSLPRYQKAGVLEPLNGYARLRESLDDWIDVLNVASVGGELFCVPAYVSAANIYIDDALALFFGAAFPESCTWSELFDLAGCFHADMNGDGRPDAYYIIDNLYYPEFVQQFITARADTACDFSDPSFMSAMTKYKSLVSCGYIGDEFAMNDTKGGLFHIGRMLDMGTFPFLPMPVLEDGSICVPGYVHGMAINVFSQNKGAAADFLALYAAAENQIYPVGFGFVKDLDLYPDAAALSQSERRQIEKSLEHYERVSPAWLDNDFADALREAVSQYIGDEITAEELVLRLNMKMEMVRQG
jgi:ABC-type glycerol-3-phosphate transport system substrate-binding protein